MEVNRQLALPVQPPRTVRQHPISGLTSGQAGKFIPLAAVPMFREDALNGSVQVSCEMLETAEILVNRVNLRLRAYCVPWLAMARFEGSREQFDRSWSGEPKIAGGATVAFFENVDIGTEGANAVYKVLGLHEPSGNLVNTMYAEGYNILWNFIAKNTSMKLDPRARLEYSLAPAFWRHSRFDNIVPSFDQAVIDGEVALTVTEGGHLPVSGIGLWNTNVGAAYNGFGASSIKESATATATTYAKGWNPDNAPAGATGHATVVIREDPAKVGYPDIWAELTGGAMKISLADIAMAQRAQAFAKLRERYEGLPDEFIIDMLMRGLTIPDLALRQPMLLGDVSAAFVQVKRFATDASNLAESATSGMATASLSFAVPKLAVGGIVYIVAEVMPDQLFERQRDPFFMVNAVADLPDALRDALDPEKVDDVLNDDIDVNHADDGETFGFEPMNAKWSRPGPRIGGKFYRPSSGTANDDVRRRIWAVETANPKLTEDFYIATGGVNNKPFLDDDSAAEPFEFSYQGNCLISGNTQFGGLLHESTTNYDAVMDAAPTERLEENDIDP